MEQLVAAMRELESADRLRTKVMRKRDAAVRAAVKAGHTYKSIREVTGMSPTTISKALGER